MIADTLKNCEKYFGAHDGFRKSFEFIRKAAEENLPVGRYEIDGEEIFAFIQEYTSNYEKDGKFEGHRKYIDIQHILSGIEVMDSINIAKATTLVEYDAQKDIGFFENNEKASRIVLEAGEYGIFFPSDIHRPGLCFEGKPGPVKKIVVKVKV